MNPTEQQELCVLRSKTEKVIKIISCAGGGKTSTLKLTAKANPVRSLYMAFNKVTADEASQGFPSYVTCQTTHSIAYRAFGVPLQHKLSRPKGAYVNVAGTGSEIAKFYGLDDIFDGSMDKICTANALGMYVKLTVERFEQSADSELQRHHVPRKDMEKILNVSPSAAYTVLSAAKRLWKDRTDTSSKVLATHDTYLKLYQLSKPILPYEVIYVDEFQDTTPCVLDIVANQMESARIVVVGDPRQAIYGWRGAINAMDMIKCNEFPLSQSFRYGQAIAEVATAILQRDMIVTGRSDIECRIGFQVVDRTQPYMYLFRTNSMLLLEAVAAIDRGEKIKVEIDTKDFVKLLQSAQALYDKKMKDVKHEKILPYASWLTLVEEAEETGGELKRIAAIVEGRQADHIISVLENYKAPADAIATYTTAHKAKGREEEQVILANDFPTNYRKGEWVGLSTPEENLAYVAATRAKRVLELNACVAEILERAGIPFEQEDQWGEEQEEAIGKAKPAQSGDFKQMMAELVADGPDGGYSSAMRGDMAIEAMHMEMGLSDTWREARRAEGLTDDEIDMLEF